MAYIIISGCARSGTSLCMNLHEQIYGTDKITGKNFPQFEARDKAGKLPEDATDIQKYLHSKRQEEVIFRNAGRRPDEETIDMNPDGFKEHAFSVKGIIYEPQFREELKEALENYKILKVVSQGLLASDPIYIKQVVYMVRHPKAVALSQERLHRNLKVKGDEGQDIDLYEDLTVHTPIMFINVSLQAMVWFKQNPEKPVKIIHYDDLVYDPENTIKEIYDFNDTEGDCESALKVINKKLDRSKPQNNINNPLWGDSEYVYSAMSKLKKCFDDNDRKKALKIIDKTLEYMRDPKRETNKENTNWFCHRAKQPTNFKACEKCMTDCTYRKNMKKFSETSQHNFSRHWTEEPCLFELGLDPERKTPLTIEESIEDNFWYQDEPVDLHKARQ